MLTELFWDHKFLSYITGCRKTQVSDCTGSTVYRITTILKVETDIIAIISMSPKGRDVILVKMCVKSFKTDVIIFIGIVITDLTDNCHNLSQFIDTKKKGPNYRQII